MTAIATSATPPPRPRIARRNDFLWIAAVAVATVVAYLPIFNAGWIWDDNYYVTNNIHLHTLHGLRELWLRPGAVPQYYPLTHTTFWIEYHLWGLHPLGYHLDNLLLHIANAALIGLLLKRLEVKGYALAAALFALHPVQVESVAWVTERKNVLSTLFYLLALWQALDFWQIDARSPVTAKKYWLCLGLFVCALLSKSVTSVLPAIILILIWWKRGRIRWKDVKWLIPFFVLGAAMGSVTAWMEAHVVGAIGPEWNWPFWQRILIASRAVWFYLGKLFWPHPLSFAYHQWSVAPSDSVYLIALLVVLVIAWRFRPLFVGVLIFLVTLSPALGFVNVYPMRYSFVADHFQYLAAAAPLAVVAALLHRLRWPVGLPILAVLGALTFHQVGPYRNAETLWRNAVAGDDQSFLAHYQLGIALLNRGDRAGAEAELQKSISIDSRFADAWVALATVAEANGNWTKAEDDLKTGQSVAPQNPLPYYQMGLLDRHRDRPDDAEAEFAAAATRLPDPAPAFEQIGEIELTRQNFPAAETQFKKALACDPDRIDTRNNLAATYLAEGNLDSAAEQAKAALVIDPDDTLACNDMGIVLARRGQADAAAEYFNRALAIDPNFQQARENLARLGR